MTIATVFGDQYQALVDEGKRTVFFQDHTDPNSHGYGIQNLSYEELYALFAWQRRRTEAMSMRLSSTVRLLEGMESIPGVDPDWP